MNFVNSLTSIFVIVVFVLDSSATDNKTEDSHNKDDYRLKLELDDVTGIYLEKAINELGETPEKKESSIKALRNLLQYERTLKVPIDEDAFLIRFLRATKYDVMKAHELVKNYYTFKENYKEASKPMLPSELKRIYEQEIVQVMPNRDKRGRRIGIMNVGKWDPSKIPAIDLFRAMRAIAELVLLEPMTQVNGGIGIVNYDGLSFSHIFAFSPSFLSMAINWAQKSIPVPLGDAYVINNSFLFNILFAIAKPFIEDEFEEKVHILNSDYSKLVKDLGPDVLEKKYGGNIKDNVPFGKYLYRLVEKHLNVFDNMTNYGYNRI